MATSVLKVRSKDQDCKAPSLPFNLGGFGLGFETNPSAKIVENVIWDSQQSMGVSSERNDQKMVSF